jgi:hypothetical protein
VNAFRSARSFVVAGAVVVAAAVGLAGCGVDGDDQVVADGTDEATDGDGTDGDDGTDDGEDDGWRLPPSGPDIPEDAERDVYLVLEAADPAGCRAELDSGELSGAPPGRFSTGDRSHHLYRAGAHLCAGDRDAGRAAFDDAIASAWVEPADPRTRDRVCRVWDAVTERVAEDAGTCTLRADTDEDGTTDDGTTDDGTTDGDTGDDGTIDDGATDAGTTGDGTTDDGATDDGAGDGTGDDGAADDGGEVDADETDADP